MNFMCVATEYAADLRDRQMKKGMSRHPFECMRLFTAAAAPADLAREKQAEPKSLEGLYGFVRRAQARTVRTVRTADTGKAAVREFGCGLASARKYRPV